MNNPKRGLYLTIYGCLMVLALAWAYYQVLHFDFINYDDDQYVYDNPVVQQGLTLRGIAWAFTTDTLGNWHPLTWLSYMLDVELFGVTPGAMHAVNVAFHILNTLLLFVLLARLTGKPGRAAFVAALFALHPLHVESVAWIAERKDVLSTFFGLLAIAAYAWYARQPSARRNMLVALLLALGLIAKPMLVTWPFVFLLLDCWPLKRSWSARLILEKWPHFLLIVASCVVTYLVQARGGAVRTFDDAALGLRLQNAVVSYAVYLGKTIWPLRLGVLYPYPDEAYATYLVLGCAALLVLVTLAVLVLARPRPYLPVGWLWYLGTLVPVIGLVRVGGQAYADRYTYIPLIGIFFAATWLVADLLEARPRLRAPVLVAACAMLVTITYLTHVQASHWRDSITLYEHTLRVAPKAGTIHFNLGNALLAAGRAEEAEAHFAAGAELRGDNSEELANLGLAQLNQGRLDEAEATFQRVLTQAPNQVEARINLGVVDLTRERFDEAIEHLEQALEFEPENALAHLNLGIVYTSLERWADAEAEFRRAAHDRADDYTVHYHLGRTLVKLGRVDEAIESLTTAAELNPERPAVHFQLGSVYLQRNRLPEAKEAFERTIALDPDHVLAEINLGIVLASQQDLAGAETHLRRAIELAPANADAHFNLALALHLTGRNDEARSHVAEALRLNPGDTRAQQLQAQLGG